VLTCELGLEFWDGPFLRHSGGGMGEVVLEGGGLGVGDL